MQSATGEYWRYFTTKGHFLSGEQARVEQDYIDRAAERRAGRSAEKERLKCAVVVARKDLSDLERDLESMQSYRRIEVKLAAYSACRELYIEDRDKSLLNATCIELFSELGLPEGKIQIDTLRLQKAQDNLRKSLSAFLAHEAQFGVRKKVEPSELENCRTLLAEQ